MLFGCCEHASNSQFSKLRRTLMLSGRAIWRTAFGFLEVFCRVYLCCVFTRRHILSLVSLLSLFLAWSPAEAATSYIFPGNLPASCSADAGEDKYSCGALTLAAGDTITIAKSKPTTITFEGALVTGVGVFINTGGNASDLTLKVKSAVTLGADSVMNANLQTLGAGAVTIGAGSWIGGNVSTETGFVVIGAGSVLLPAPQQTGVGGNVTTITGYISMGVSSVVNGTIVTRSAGYVALGAGAKVSGGISTLGAGYITLGANAHVGGSIVASGQTGADYVVLGELAIVNGNISTSGSYITLGAFSQVSGNISTKIGYIAVGALAQVGGQISMNDPSPSYISIGLLGSVYAVCCNGTDASCVTPNLLSNIMGLLITRPLVCVTTATAEPASFAFLEQGASYNNLVGNPNLRNPLYTKLVGSSFTFDLVALRADGQIETSYASASNKSVSLDLVDGSGVIACATRAAIAPAISQILTFASIAAGRKTIVAVTLNHTYSNLRWRVTDASQSPKIISCSTDNFSVRPDAATLLTSASAVSPFAGSIPAIKAGTGFTLGVTTSAGSGYSGVLILDSSKLSAQDVSQGDTQVVGGVVGELSTQSLIANTASVGTTYSEAGYLYLTAGAFRDEAFTMVDSVNGDCITSTDSNNNLADTLIGGKYGCHIGNKSAVSLGRFYPDHFAVSAVNIIAACSAHNPFTYFGQDGLTANFKLTAQNYANNSTQNYAGIFAKLDPSNYSAFRFSASPLPVGSNMLGSVIAPINTWKNGAINISTKHQISRPTSPTAESAILISASPTDGEVLSSLASVMGGANIVRYGRLKMQNIYGSELLALPVPIEAQYWNGLTYIRNQDDSCTTIVASNISMSNFQKNLTACETQAKYTFGSGKFNNGVSSYLSLSKPGATNDGSVDLTINLNNVSGNSCTSLMVSAATAANISWFGSNPVSRATFGIYKSPVIYMRENY